MEYRLKRYDGEYRWISASAVPRFNSNGRFEGYIGACMDIQDQVAAQIKLKEEEEKLNIVIDASGLGTWELDLIKMELKFSDRFSEIFGWHERQNLSYANFEKQFHPEDLGIRKRAYRKAYQSSELKYVSRIFWEDGSVHWIEVKGYAFFDDNQKAIKLIGTIGDITKEKSREQELLESEQKFRLLADSLPQQIWTTDPKGNLNYFNQSIFNYSGLTPEQLYTDGWTQILHPEEREENHLLWRESIFTGKEFRNEHQFRRHDGEYRWHISRAIPQRDSEGNIQMWVGTSTDIQDQKTFVIELEKMVQQRTKELYQLNESLKKSEGRYHLMVEEVQDYAILYLNIDGTIENWNKGAEKITGFKSEEILGKNFEVFFPKVDRENKLPKQLLDNASKYGKAVKEGWKLKKGGGKLWANLVITAMKNGQDEVIGFSIVTHDLTERKEAENKLQKTALQLEQKNFELEMINKELQSFTYISSHDLQEPLRKIQIFSSIIMEQEYDKLSETGKNNFQRMKNSAMRMQDLIVDLLTYSRTNIEKRKFEVTDLNKLVLEVKEGLKEELEQKNAVLEIGKMHSAKAVPFQFRQLMQNLISNALKFSKDGQSPHIKINSEIKSGKSLKNEGLNKGLKYHHICISDNGIGFDPNYNKKIFEVFQRLHGNNRYKGTGIGLAIVKKIVDNHNGIITAKGEIGKGATFDIYLPIKE